MGGTPIAGVGTTARALATATVTNGVVSGITVTSPGVAYTSGNPPQVLIASPNYTREEIKLRHIVEIMVLFLVLVLLQTYHGQMGLVLQ